MQTFSCAVQTIQIDDDAVTFGVDPADTSICTLTINETVARFNRNGELIDIAYPEPDDGEAEAPGEASPSGTEPDVVPYTKTKEPTNE